ncbi:MAG: hypothetical protein ACXVPN_10660 [Bacteroidia bacterium]
MKFIKTAILFTIVLLLLGCKKKLFKHVEVHGRVIDTTFNFTMDADIYLYARDTPSTKRSILLGHTNTSSSGIFDLKPRHLFIHHII